MKKSSINWNVKQFIKMVDKGTISFDYPIQREGSQWDNLQKSLLIHSLAEDYPVPALYSITNEEEIDGKTVNVYYILDGKQRLTNIRDFVKGEYALHEETPNAVIDGVEYELAGKTFSELEEDVQDAILSYTLLIYKMDEITDEQIEELFFRLNNGTPLSKQQKAKAKMGTAWAEKIQKLVKHPMMTEKASFTELQKRKADHETAILQTMMLLDNNYEWKSISSNDVFEYAQTFKGDNSKDVLVEKILKAMDYINEAFQEKETVLLKKIHFPMTLLTAMKAMEMGIDPIRFSDWKEEFKKSLKRKGKISTNYKYYSGAGSVKKEKTLGRIKEMQEHMEKFFAQFANSQKEAEKIEA
jgi:Protein of unknown function DUF262